MNRSKTLYVFLFLCITIACALRYFVLLNTQHLDGESIVRIIFSCRFSENPWKLLSGVKIIEYGTGRGRALRFRILNSSFSFVGYMDIDLSSNLSGLLRMYEELARGYDVVIGSRLLPGAEVQRSLIRRFLSTGYSFLVRWVLNLPYKDYQCGFKLFRRKQILNLLSLIKNNNWFFDTELIYYAHNNKLRIKEVPVLWKERKRGKVRLIPTIVEDILGIVRLKLKNG